MTDPDTPIARPGQPLSTHLDGVVENATTTMSVPADATTPAGDSLQGLISTVAHLHDIGKLTSAFQEYIRADADRSPTEREYHAAPGALLTFHALASQGYSLSGATSGFYAVLKHHQTLPNIEEEHSNWCHDTGNYVGIQTKLQDIETTASQHADERLRKATDGALAWEDVRVDDPAWYADQFDSVPFGDAFEEFYPLLQRVWSTLVCADKMDAADVPLSPVIERPDPSRIRFDNEATGIERELNQYRSEAQADVLDRLDTIDTDGNKVFTLTLPTGFGKTFAGLKAALARANHVDGRVVYALPYTTILDQVDNDIRTHLGVAPASESYTLHHHLADTRTRLDRHVERVSDGTETLYGESWQAGLVLTTFVQLFESLAGPANTQSMKLPALQDAVIIIDEPQVLPRAWWRLVTQLIETLTTNYDATVILMTATQPRFIDRSSVPLDPSPLLDSSPYFEFLQDNERVAFDIDDSVPIGGESTSEPRTPTDAGQELVKHACSDGGATLSIANTVQSATELGAGVRDAARDRSLRVVNLGAVLESFVDAQSERVVDRLGGDADVETLADEFVAAVQQRCHEQNADLLTASLTAALRPSDRVLLIEAVSTLLADGPSTAVECPLVVSSTQLVEAGVDLSFDRVYRDFAPVPNLAQAAGRCNRSFEGTGGRVVLWRLSSPAHDRLPSQLIYRRGGDRLTPTTVALNHIGEGDEAVPEFTMITEGVEQYYETLHDADHRSHDQDSLVNAYTRAKGDTLREASLIEDHSEDVLVVTTDAEAAVLERYLREKVSENVPRGRTAMATLQQLFASVPADRAERLDESDEIVRELGFDAGLLEEFAVVDARGQTRYDIQNGAGIREIQ